MGVKAKVVFCFPFRGVGGVSLLFLRVGEDLAARNLAQVCFVDYADGFLAQHRRSDLTDFVEYRDNAEVCIPEGSTLILQSITPWSLFPSLRIPATCKVVFWNCHPFNLVPTLPGFRRQMQANPVLGRAVIATVLRPFLSKMKALVRFMVDRQALVFMDATNVSVTERYLGMSLPAPLFLPVAAQSVTRFKSCVWPTGEPTGLRVAWIGRIVDMKYYILKYALEEMSRVQADLPFPITMTVVGSGEALERTRREAERLTRLITRFIDHIPPEELDDFLLNEVDLLLAMGTSALEGARLGVPTILLDVSYGEVTRGYLFTWLYERAGFSLGDLLGAQHFQQGNRSLRVKIDELVADFARVSTRTREYFEANHSVTSVAARLLEIVDRSSCSYGALVQAGLMRPSIAYQVFSTIRKYFQANESSHTGRRTGHAS